MTDALRTVGCVLLLRFAGMHPRLARWLGWTGPEYEPDIFC